jgi:hypothetical protein
MIIMSMTHHALTRHGARALEILDTYWSGLAVQGDLPLWSDVDPGQFQDALDHAFLAESFGRSHARIRVAGGSVSDMAGTPCSGLALSLLIRPEDRTEFNEAVRLCHTGGAVDIDLTTGGEAANRDVSAQMVLYPLRDTTGRVTQLLGGVAAIGDAPAPATRPFGVGKVRARPALACRSRLRLVVDNT